MGINVTFVDQTDMSTFERAITPRTRLVMLESPSNPLMRLTDLRAIAEIAKARSVTTLIDNTIATPINQRPLALGIDLVMHSATKYLSGHGDVSAGVLVGSKDLIGAVWDKAHILGATLDPFAAWLALRGLRTLPMRVARQNLTAAAIAQCLETHPLIERIHYPGLPCHPQYRLGLEQMTGAGGVFSFEVRGGAAAAERVLGKLKLARRAASFGSFAALAVHPAAMWAGMMTDEQLAASGVPPGLIRFAVGFEDSDDLVTDIFSALDATARETP